MAPRFDPRQMLMALRDGQSVSPADVRAFALGIGDGSLSDAQLGAFAMAVCQRGLGPDGRNALTLAMRDSGDILSWDLPGPVVDKHSTGGIGDSISLLLAPALAACGAYVPMISGRGLGHSGGTLDKLEAIPGYQVQLEESRFRQITATVGCAIAGATGRIAPADKRLYAVRDVTGTVESVDLITASILSKKLAAGLSCLVLDVKLGSGAFMAQADAARQLAQALVQTANAAGCRTQALITDMDQPLGSSAGNALEVAEVMETLTGGQRSDRLWALTCELGGVLLEMAGLAPDLPDGRARIDAALRSGRAAEQFARMVAAQGGPADFAEAWQQHLPRAPVVRDVFPDQPGQVCAVDGRAIGMAVIVLGGGRLRESDRIDPSVGFSQLVHIGSQVGPEQPLGRVSAADAGAADQAAQALRAAYQVGTALRVPPLVYERIGGMQPRPSGGTDAAR